MIGYIFDAPDSREGRVNRTCRLERKGAIKPNFSFFIDTVLSFIIDLSAFACLFLVFVFRARGRTRHKAGQTPIRENVFP